MNNLDSNKVNIFEYIFIRLDFIWRLIASIFIIWIINVVRKYILGILKPGRYEYPFSIDLPVDIPSSFDDHPALVQYILKAVVDIPSNSQEDVVILHVFANVDLRKFEKDLIMVTCTDLKIKHLTLNIPKCKRVKGS